MKKGTPYQNYNNIYQIAHGLQGDKGLLLSSNRAIFSAICSVLSLDDEQIKRRILKDEPFDFSQEVIRRFNERDLEYFIDVWPEGKGMVWRHDVPFQVWDKDDQLKYMTKEIDSSYYPENSGIKLASAKTRRNYFPTTVFFENRHYKEDLTSGIFTIIVEELHKK